MDPSQNPYPPLLSLAVHEFRTPASVVGGYLRMLQKDQDPPMSERQRHMIDEAEKSCARLVAIVAELSDIGKLDSGIVKLGATAGGPVFACWRKWPSSCMRRRSATCSSKLIGPSDGAQITGDADTASHGVRRDFPGDSA